MKIQHAQRIDVNIPFYCERVERAMHRAPSHSERLYLCRIETDTGLTGYGDGLYPPETENLIGRNPFDVLFDDTVGHPAQIALLDVCAKAVGVPAHKLLGTQVRSRCPVSWWNMDMVPQEWAQEAIESVKRGYTCFKMKSRPWFDLIEQIKTVSKVVPDDYQFDLDFNGSLLTPARAELMLRQLDDLPNTGIYESPFYAWDDLAGARDLRQRVCNPIAEHFTPAVLEANASDGFVIGGGLNAIRMQATLAANANKPFFLQMVGSGLTAAYVVQIGAVLTHAQWPYISCHEIYEHDLLKLRLEVVDGYIAVPDTPGLGVEVDEKALERYRVDPDEPIPAEVFRSKRRIARITWPGGARQRVHEFADRSYSDAFNHGNLPSFEPGVSKEMIEDDGSAAFNKRYEELAARGP